MYVENLRGCIVVSICKMSKLTISILILTSHMPGRYKGVVLHGSIGRVERDFNPGSQMGQ